MQRFFDFFFSLIALILLSPLLLPICAVLRFTGEHEIFYIQKRIGKHGTYFNLLKFATMLKNSPSLATGSITVKNDPRVLPVGKFLRKTKINELPQLINVLIGDMSLIGPRPLTDQTFNAYPTHVQDIVKTVKPGLSGIGSIIFRGEEDILASSNSSIDIYRNTIAPYKGELEIWYVNNRTLATYFKAIYVTLLVVIYPKSGIVWGLFKTLPEPSDSLKKILVGYSD